MGIFKEAYIPSIMQVARANNDIVYQNLIMRMEKCHIYSCVLINKLYLFFKYVFNILVIVI